MGDSVAEPQLGAESIAGKSMADDEPINGRPPFPCPCIWISSHFQFTLSVRL